MDLRQQDSVRQTVRQAYKKVVSRTAADSSQKNEQAQEGSCCSYPGTVPNKSSGAGCGCNTFHANYEKISETLGYTQSDIASVPEGANMGLGCGNPVALASLRPDETVVDLGSGGGFDCFLAARKVGEHGQVIGVDMTPEMISKARENVTKLNLKNVEFRLGEIENLPVADNLADIVISNCVVNLSPNKLAVFQEAHRILKPGGRLAISDILATAPLPPRIKEDLALLTACIGGAATIGDTENILKEAGFSSITITPIEISRDILKDWAPTMQEDISDYVVSASIEAIK